MHSNSKATGGEDVQLIARRASVRAVFISTLFLNNANFTFVEIFLTEEEKDKLHDFELQCLEDFLRQKEYKVQTSANKRISTISERWGLNQLQLI